VSGCLVNLLFLWLGLCGLTWLVYTYVSNWVLAGLGVVGGVLAVLTFTTIKELRPRNLSQPDHHPDPRSRSERSANRGDGRGNRSGRRL
jgi:hypothetical protein